MSEETTETPETPTSSEFQPKKLEMTQAEFMQKEHLVQTGVTDELPDGRKVADVQKFLAEEQARQEEQLKQLGEERRKKRAEKKGEPTEVKSEKIEVVVHENGVITGSNPVIDEPAPPNNQEPDNDLPPDLPGRKHFLAAGIVSLEKVASFDLEALQGIAGIGDATAEKVLTYGK